MILRRVVIGTFIGGILSAILIPIGLFQAMVVPTPFCAFVGAVISVLIYGLAILARVPIRHSALWQLTAIETWLTAVLVVAILVGVSPAINRARAAARRTHVRNNMKQHSGSHADAVYLDSEMQVVRVSICPVCSRPDTEVFFYVDSGEQPHLHNASDPAIPIDTFLRAKQMIEQSKQNPR
ncbi:hypothetical protein CA54_15880 [Symmachiella macrocystis]|uniref:Uncharacterized protein n=1 Tax=Symmachiella macrocystis TaxID=2527985 RepID=A0A5C6BKU9_9PLAN|nr:hypothetical protein [Symmachiella macrocystis]TWU12763.1 hypothetical protein CA54_15880 [Symmachiella macrocystis]